MAAKWLGGCLGSGPIVRQDPVAGQHIPPTAVSPGTKRRARFPTLLHTYGSKVQVVIEQPCCNLHMLHPYGEICKKFGSQATFKGGCSSLQQRLAHRLLE